MHYHRCTADPVLHFRPLYLPEKVVDLIYIATLGILAWFLHIGARGSERKRRRYVPNVKPPLFPVDELITQLVRDVFRFLPLTNCNVGRKSKLQHDSQFTFHGSILDHHPLWKVNQSYYANLHAMSTISLSNL